jgi:hypothetical protein
MANRALIVQRELFAKLPSVVICPWDDDALLLRVNRALALFLSIE